MAASHGSTTARVAAYSLDDADTFELPEDISSVTGEELAALEQTAREAFDVLKGGELTPDVLADMEALTEAVAAIRTEQGARADAAEAAAARAEEMAAAMSLDEEAEVADEDEPVAEAEVEVSDEEIAEVVAEAEAATETAPEPVAASAPRRSVDLSAVRRRQPRQPEPEVQDDSPRVSILASADVPGFSAGGEMTDVAELGRAMISRSNALGNKGGASGRLSFATLRMPTDPQAVVRDDSPVASQAAIDHVTSEKNLPGGSLVAAGGWCAPADIAYDSLCPSLTSLEGFISLPTVSTPRGRVQVFDTNYGVGDINGGSPITTFTEADDIAGRYVAPVPPATANTVGDKTCLRVPCPTPRTVTLDGGYACAEVGLQTMRAFPELVSRWTEEFLKAVAHQRNSERIEAMVGGSTTVALANTAGATAHILASLELYSQHIRHKHRMAQSATVEVVLPYWAKSLIRSDLSKRLGVDLLNVTDAAISSWFTTRQLNVTYVYGWQHGSTLDGNSIGHGTNNPTGYPTTLSALMYPAGTWLLFNQPDLDMGLIVDSAYVKSNDRPATSFLEYFEKVEKLCFDSYKLDLGVCADGSTQAGVDIPCTTP